MARSSRGHDELEIFIFVAAKCAAAVWQELCRGDRSRRRYIILSHRQVGDDLFPSIVRRRVVETGEGQET